MHTKFRSGKLDHLEYLGVGGRLILKVPLKNIVFGCGLGLPGLG
jgi:hypothetical protein